MQEDEHDGPIDLTRARADVVRLLQAIASDPSAVLDDGDLLQALARAYKSVRKQRRKRSAAENAGAKRDVPSGRTAGGHSARTRRRQRRRARAWEHDGPLIARTQLVADRLEGDPSRDASAHGGPAATVAVRVCYICGTRYQELHRRYHRLCPSCAAENERRREARADLAGRHALVTGGRVKIGRALACNLLRDGAVVAVTSRSAAAARGRYEEQPDYDGFRDRLRVYEVDFRDLQAVRAFAARMQVDFPALDILVNCAAQTVRRPTGADRADDAPEVANSWRAGLEEVHPVEVVEALLINAAAPYLLCSALLPLMRRSSFPQRTVVNVTGVDGLFADRKSPGHPHVNMSKAALNMLTHTSAQECIAHGIAMNSVDPGWVSDESPLADTGDADARLRRIPPLDVIDGAARIYDAVLQSLAADPPHGQLFQHYRLCAWGPAGA